MGDKRERKKGREEERKRVSMEKRKFNGHKTENLGNRKQGNAEKAIKLNSVFQNVLPV